MKSNTFQGYRQCNTHSIYLWHVFHDYMEVNAGGCVFRDLVGVLHNSRMIETLQCLHLFGKGILNLSTYVI